MKWTLLVVLFTAIYCSAQAQPYNKKIADAVVADAPVNIASEKVNEIYIEPPVAFNRLKSTGSADTKIEVIYENFPQEAKHAFEYAVSIWERMITSPVPVKIHAKWEKLEGNVLALSRPSTFHVNFEGAPFSNIYYPVSLAEKLSGKDINQGEPDIICRFNSKYPWYFGTDGKTPVTQYDLVSSVLHEITHGLGVSGFLKVDGDAGFFDNNNNLPSIYDYYIFNARNQQISDKSLFNSPSSDLHNQLTSDGLKFFDPNKHSGQGEMVDWIYAPSTWRDGASIYHMKGSGYDNGLMTPYANKGEAIHNPGENVIRILSEMGWKSVTFDFTALKDMEEPQAEIPVQIAVFSDVDTDTSTVKVIYSTDYFSTSKSVKLNFDKSVNKFTGKIPVDFHLGNIQYYFTSKSEENQIFNWPAQAPQKKFSLRIGPDYASPELTHNPVKIISGGNRNLNISVYAQDNLGINSVKLEYKLNGVLQEPLLLSAESNNLYTGTVYLPENLINNTAVEYRIIAKDNSANGNISTLPKTDFHKVIVAQTLKPVKQYSADFENNATDFATADFDISQPMGFNSKILHTNSPYKVSALENENYDHVAQLRYPVILEENGELTFDEVVLVEPGDPQADYRDRLFWDYVIVEASKDDGITWLPLTDGYDSGNDELWYEKFTAGLKSNISTATGDESMFLKQTVNLTEHQDLSAGDTIIIRFRLSSDKSVNGWGWAIENLEIQQNAPSAGNDFLAETNVGVFPNPFNNSFFVDCSDATEAANINIEVTDLFGKTVYKATDVNVSFDPKVRIDLTNNNPGIYLVNVYDENSVITTNKLVKN